MLPPIDAPVVKPRHWGRLVGVCVLLAFLCLVIVTLVGGDVKWELVPKYFVDERLLRGVVGTLELTVAAMALGIVLGVGAAIMRDSQDPVLQSVAVGYIWLFRAVPTIVQLLVWFNLSLLIKHIGIPGLFEFDTNTVMTPFVAAILGLGLSEGAYMAEIVRGGIEGVHRGQVEAAKSLGMTRSTTMWRIVLPQATRQIVPPTGNETINMLKYTSLAFFISYAELLSQGKKIYQTNFEVLEVLFACSAWYLILVFVLTLGQRQLERRLARRSGIGER